MSEISCIFLILRPDFFRLNFGCDINRKNPVPPKISIEIF